MAAKTTNEMIFATLKTKGDKPAKYAEQLRELGYDVTNVERYGDLECEREYWAVNGLHLVNPGNEPIYIGLRNQHVSKLANIAKIDFVNYLATFDERKAKGMLINAHDGIWEQRMYYTGKRVVYVDEDGFEWSWPRCNTTKVVRGHHRHVYDSGNSTIEEYRNIKRKAEACGYGWRADQKDYEIELAERLVKDAEEKVERLWKELAEAEAYVERRKEALQKEINRKAEGQDELDAWLKAKGIR